MRSPAKLLLVFLMALLLYGCDSGRYQIVTGSDGSLYRFNKKTGELSIIMEDKKVVRLSETKKSDIVGDGRENSLDKPIDWKESKYPGKDLKVRFETVWRENRLCYKFTVYPYKSLERIFAKKKQDYVYSLMKPGFTIEIVDKNGFMIKDIKVNLSNMSKVNDAAGQVESLVMNSQIDCSRQSYRSIGGYIMKWTLDGDMLDDDKDVKNEKK